MTPEQLQHACTISLDRASTWAPHINEAAERFRIDTTDRRSAFLAHVMHDTDGFERLSIDLRGLTARRIFALWPDQFSGVDAAQAYTGSGIALCNRIFATCRGNGSVSTGDGYRYRPRGLLHLCGRFVYERASLGLGYDFIDDPDALCVPRWAALSAGWYWDEENFNYFADKGDIDSITRILDRRDLSERRPDHDAVMTTFYEIGAVLN